MNGLTEKVIYTVRALDVSEVDGEPVILLCEIKRHPTPWETREPGYRASRFRPIVSRETDITIFEEIRDGKRRVADPDALTEADARAIESAMADAFPHLRPDYVEKWGNE